MSDPQHAHAGIEIILRFTGPRNKNSEHGRYSAQAFMNFPGVSHMRLILVILLVLVLIGAFPVWPYSAGWGYYPTGGVSLLVIIVVVILFAR
jgi:hypothetical protein